MIIGETTSKNSVKIRLTSERWKHITYSHKEIGPGNFSEILKTVKDPDAILEGDSGELFAAKQKARSKYWLVVIYKEENNTGFVITAYITTDAKWLFKRKVTWSKK